ncbi:MAG: ATP-binding protein [Firmicutes bacterium]|nr:ATP-binding protein [Bacillota bacterium]
MRIAIYDSMSTVPRIMDIDSEDLSGLLDEIANKTYSLSHEKGGKVPYIAIKEIVENLLHAEFKDAVISILPDGNTIRVSDQGPGILEKERAFLPGFTTATQEMRTYIRGVGSGLPIVRDSLRAIGGMMTVEDNLRSGCVVTLTIPGPDSGPRPELAGVITQARTDPAASSRTEPTANSFVGAVEKPEKQEKGGKPDRLSAEHEKLNEILSPRQKKVFLLIADIGEAGPSTIVKELDISLSTAYRDLVTLEEHGLLMPVDNTGKRKLTEKGVAYLGALFQ